MIFFLFIWFGVMFLALGLLGPSSIQKRYPSEAILVASNRFLIYYLLTDLVLRILFVPSLTLGLRELLLLHATKKSIINGVLMVSLLWIYNFICVIFLFIFLRSTIKLDATINPFLWGMMMFFLLIINHFLALLLRQITGNIKVLILVILVVIALTIFSYLNVFLFHSVSIAVFNYLLFKPILIALLIIPGILLYLINFSLLKRNLYFS